jgi:hypothetical protein
MQLETIFKDALLNPLHLSIDFTDMIRRLRICLVQGNFSAAWEELGEENELSDAFSLPMKSLEEAVKNITLYLGLQVSFPPVSGAGSDFANPVTWTMQTCKLLGNVSSTCREQCYKTTVSRLPLNLHRNVRKKGRIGSSQG